MLGDIGLPELLVIFVIVLVLFGPGKLPDVGKAIGEAVRGFKKAMRADEESIENKAPRKRRTANKKIMRETEESYALHLYFWHRGCCFICISEGRGDKVA